VSRSTRYLFFDTETSGLPRQMDAPVARLENWPRVVQLAWILTDFQGQVISQRQFLIQPTGWRMQPGALKVHGITLAHARRHGHPLPDVLHRFALDLLQTDSIIGHNVTFDQKILGAEFLRLGQTNPLQRRHAQCTMKMGAVFLQRWTRPQPISDHQASASNAPFSNARTADPAEMNPVDSGLLEIATSVETEGAVPSYGVSQADTVSEAIANYRVDSARSGVSAPRTAVEGATWRDSGSGFRYPSLRRLHRTLFGYEFDNAHDALADTQACLNCFFKMCRQSLS